MKCWFAKVITLCWKEKNIRTWGCERLNKQLTTVWTKRETDGAVQIVVEVFESNSASSIWSSSAKADLTHCSTKDFLDWANRKVSWCFFFFLVTCLENSVRSITVIAFKQDRNPRGRVALTPVPVKAEPRVLLVNTKLPTEQAHSVTDTALSRRT
ncbi:unnamed protein product [Mytilus edulis]|uniref:Uncharacterized protein n=1 Tax=Mytilus edulis TaxID=6550 RepID=A0A8S3TK04_MYTED|nr:unnamed protein product [Mytilus edulis]